jgi:hypothetical protein
VAISKIDTAIVREWRMALLAEGASASEAAKAYRFLRAVLMTAVDDLIIARNPCRIRGAGEEKPDERPVLTVSQVLDLADRVQDRPRAGSSCRVCRPALGRGDGIASLRY